MGRREKFTMTPDRARTGSSMYIRLCAFCDSEGLSGLSSEFARMLGTFSEGCCLCMVFKEMALRVS
jgi:hypothetical protein